MNSMVINGDLCFAMEISRNLIDDKLKDKLIVLRTTENFFVKTMTENFINRDVKLKTMENKL